jgi:CRP-like cAMP-binding protein
MKILTRRELSYTTLKFTAGGLGEQLSDEDLKALSSYGEWILAKNEMIVSDGEEQGYLYIVIDGEVEVFKQIGDITEEGEINRQVLATMEPGKCFGDMALLSGGAATASVEAKGQTYIWRIDHMNLLEFVGSYEGGGQLSLNLANILCNRVINGNGMVLALALEFNNFITKYAPQDVSEEDQESIDAMKTKLGEMTKSLTDEDGKSKISPVITISLGVLLVLSLVGHVVRFIF